MKEKVKFNLYSILFEPNKSNSLLNSSAILEKVLHFVTPVNLGNKVHLVDRNKNRSESRPRELFVDYVTYDYKVKRYKCRIVLIRTGRPPMLKPYDSHNLVSLEEIKQLGTLVEVTHFYIDMSKTKPYLFVEFHANGPRALDIEYYFRNVSRDMLSISKETKIQTYLDVSIDKVLDDMKDISSFQIKIEPERLEGVEQNLRKKYFTALSSFGRLVNSRFLTIKASFEISERNGVKYDNREAKTMLGRLLRSINNRTTELDSFKSLAIEYNDMNGESRDINLIKHQKGFEIEIDFTTITKNKQWYELVKDEIDKIMLKL